MTNRQTTAKATTKDGELTVQQHETDSPVIPVAAMERLHAFKPEAVDWIINQTQIEAEYRRAETKRTNTFVFIENFFGQLCALAIGLAGVGGGIYAAVAGQPIAGATIATAALAGLGLAAVFIKPKK